MPHDLPPRKGLPAAPPLDEQRILELAVLPEHEWRLAILRLMLRLEERVDENTDITADTQETVNRDIGEIKDILLALKGGIKVLGWFGTAAKWIAAPLMLFAAVIAAIKAGQSLPEILDVVAKHVISK